MELEDDNPDEDYYNTEDDKQKYEDYTKDWYEEEKHDAQDEYWTYAVRMER
jgi:hypothetical protein